MSTLLNFLVGIPGEWRRADTIGHISGCRQAAMSGISAVSPLAVEYRALPSPTGEATIESPARETPRADQSGERNGGTIPWHPAIGQNA